MMDVTGILDLGQLLLLASRGLGDVGVLLFFLSASQAT